MGAANNREVGSTEADYGITTDGSVAMREKSVSSAAFKVKYLTT
jgi:hypothetical protein